MSNRTLLVHAKVAFFIAVLFLTWGTNTQIAFAEIFYPSIGYRVQGPPTYCTIITGIDEHDSKVDEFVGISHDAVYNWRDNLQSAENEIKAVWEMNHKTVHGTTPDCDILVQYKPYYAESFRPASHDVIAGTFSTEGLITIYYLQPYLCEVDTLCYYDDEYRDTELMFSTMLHEIGHSLGADHYVSNNPDENKKWSSGDEIPPSIMIPSLPPNAASFTIKSADIQKIRDIYGERGFYLYSDRPVPTARPFVTIDISNDIVMTDKSNDNTVVISGQVSKTILFDGHPIIISVIKPDHTVEVLTVSPTRSGYFEVLTAYDSDSPLGLYTVSVSYIGVVDTEMNVHFEVTNSAAKDKISFSFSDPASSIDTQQTAVNSLVEQADEIKKIISKISTSKMTQSDSKLVLALIQSVGLKIESAQLQLENAKERFATDDHDAVFVSLKDLDKSIKSATNTLDRIDAQIEPYGVENTSFDLEKAKNAAKRWSTGLVDGTEFASVISMRNESTIDAQSIPNWVKMASWWWAQDRISDEEFVNLIEYLDQNDIL